MVTHRAETTAAALSDRYRHVREQSLALIKELLAEDTVVQTMPDVSPTKWHLAHITWFFERFVLEPGLNDYSRFNDDYHYLFNSYYYTAGQMHARAKRGLLSRPTLNQVLDYRSYVDTAMQQLLHNNAIDKDIIKVIALGLNHEQQHQELMLTDIKHVFSCNPIRPPVSTSLDFAPALQVAPYSYSDGEAGIRPVGFAGDGFAFDNETPRHNTLLHAHRIGTRLVTNGEYREFIQAGGYQNPELWLSDGWATINARGWQRPLYWDEELQREFTLGGERDIDDKSVTTKPTHLPVGRALAYQRNLNGRQLQSSMRFVATFWNPITGTRSHRKARRILATYGNGPRLRTRHTLGSNRWKGRSANTTASSCAAR